MLTAAVLLVLLLLLACQPERPLGFSTHGLYAASRARSPLRGKLTETGHQRRISFDRLPLHGMFCDESDKQRPSTSLSATVGRAVYIDNYAGKQLTKATALGLGLADFFLEPKVLNTVGYAIAFVGVVVFAFFKKAFGTTIGLVVNKLLHRGKAPPPAVEKQQIFECQKCTHQIRPAKNRAKQVLGSSSFHCPRCGAKGSSFFDITDMKDPRAVARKKRLESEADDLNEGLDS